MASLWNALRQEVIGTVDEFRQKGALGALRDAALDARDMASDGLQWVGDGVKTIVAGDEGLEAYLRAETMPARGATAPLEFADGTIVEATVLEVDGVSDPPRVKVAAPGLEEPLLVSLLAPGAAFPQPAAAGRGSILDILKEEVQGTMTDFREKGAVTMFKDAALDAVEIVGSTAGKAAEGARSLASPLIDLDSTPEARPEGQTEEQQSQSTIHQFVSGLKQEFKDTVQDFREKGAVTTFKDAALDAVDLVGSTAATAVEGAKSVAKQTLPDLWAGQEQGPSGATESPPGEAESHGNSSASTAPAPEQPAPAASSSSAAAAAASPSSASEKSGDSAGYAASPAPAAAAAKSPGDTSPGTGSGGYASGSPKAPPKVTKPPSEAPSSDMQDGKPARKSIVSMRRNMFEKAKEEPKKEDEEMID
eukprot:TRINITY_DN44870_c0_g1_i1.p1 TRINITY_DN44870_c0_g1~~TRINITY_DN44870_c0_g1_i1.p1  ORF type:complete len:437 (+),score=115.48 TRINITY_DN44870_c0_g1_i1:51-1313(+)